MISLKHIDTPVGKMRIGATDEGICLFDFLYRKSIDSIMSRIEQLSGDRFEEGEHPHFVLLEQQMAEYFAGTRKVFDLSLHFVGTPFQKSVWEALLQIPYGETRSYKQQSIFLGDEKAIRAVAGANGQNGIAIIVPCHRVIGEDGSLTGYGGGLQRKKWLLALERKHSGKVVQAELF
ncbi:MAG: cysteine methyltransferase [Flavipsychrobacter sp.]|jgi:AraC family transcriptional regulator of adaptative response/methylated-DNA-[protein]-cysteine methyltransferase|nr:cysteine methyltransferase [Flavipsychrobacter sp.]